jgi:hypothetical protein
MEKGNRKGEEKKWFKVTHRMAGYWTHMVTTEKGKEGRQTEEKMGERECKTALLECTKKIQTNIKKLYIPNLTVTKST